MSFYTVLLPIAETLKDALPLLRRWADFTAGFAVSICVVVPSLPGPGPKAIFLIQTLIWHEDFFPSIPQPGIYRCNSGHRKAELTFPLDVTSGYHTGSWERAAGGTLRRFPCSGCSSEAGSSSAHAASQAHHRLTIRHNRSEGFFAHPKAASLKPLVL